LYGDSNSDYVKHLLDFVRIGKECKPNIYINNKLSVEIFTMSFNTKRFLVLVASILFTFILGTWLELDYRILTRRAIIFFADYELGFYPGKDFRILETDIAFILTLLPIGLFFIVRKLDSSVNTIGFIGAYIFFIAIFYCFFCYAESQYIKYTVTTPTFDNGALKYHLRNVNYRSILFLTLLSSFTCVFVLKKYYLSKKN